MPPLCHQTDVMTTPEVTTTLRLRDKDVLDQLRDSAEAEDRSVNYVINQAIEDYLNARSPKASFPDSDGRSTYQATLRWSMPGFAGDPDKGEPNTEYTIDRMMTELCAVIRTYGADNHIEVDGPIGVFPMATRTSTLQ